MSSPPGVFISYSHKDEAWKDRLLTQLEVLEFEGHLSAWDDRRIGAGDGWKAEIEAALGAAKLAVLLVSADFLTSKFIRGEECPRLLQRRQDEGLRIVPVIVRPCAWQEVGWLSEMQARPRDGRPLSGGSKHQVETELVSIVREILALVRKSSGPESRPDGLGPGRGRPSQAKATLLFLAANPDDSLKLALDEEARDIQAKIRAADYRDSLAFETRWAVRPDDLLQALNECRPAIVHFSGHGSGEAIFLKGDDGGSRPVSSAALAKLFRPFEGEVRLVVFNACFSEEQAKAVTTTVDCAVGMSSAIGDDAARVFAASFYRAIGFGRSAANAFQQGLAALLVHDIPEEQTPRLVARDGVDPGGLFLLGPARP